MIRPETVKKYGVPVAAFGFATMAAVLGRENRSLKKQLFWNKWSQTEMMKRIDEAEKRATTDPLTGLYNRRVAEKKYDKLVAAKNRRRDTDKSNELEPIKHSVIMMDLDNFSDINNTQGGHNAGDQALREVANIIAGRARDGDLAVRWGGDEFMLILEHTDETGALKPAGDIRRMAAASGVKMSVGVAVIDLSGENLAEGAKKADDALFAAKNYGRNQVVAASTIAKLPDTA